MSGEADSAPGKSMSSAESAPGVPVSPAAPDELATKGAAVEEWIDLKFFRPLGIKIARALEPTKATPDQVTWWGAVIGLVASHLYVYASPWINVLAFFLVVVADLLDSADGQLARLRGTASRTGRILDGAADNFRWVFLYIHLFIRLWISGWSGFSAIFVTIVGLTHSLHSSTCDLVQAAYLEIVARKGHVELPEDLKPPPSQSFWWRGANATYEDFQKRQAKMFSATGDLLRMSRRGELSDAQRAEYERRQKELLTVLPWIAQNAHIIVLGVCGIIGRVDIYLYVVLAMTAVALGIRAATEKNARFVAEMKSETKPEAEAT
jgi:hypothetical protein